jgi:hypothetical protein
MKSLAMRKSRLDSRRKQRKKEILGCTLRVQPWLSEKRIFGWKLIVPNQPQGPSTLPQGAQMSNQTNIQEKPKQKVIRQGGASEAVYGLGIIGAWVYYFTHSATFLLGVVGFFKGIVWPAMLVYEALKYFQM